VLILLEECFLIWDREVSLEHTQRIQRDDTFSLSFSFNTAVQIVKSGHRNELASRSSLFLAYTASSYVQLIASELPAQIAQCVAKCDWQCMP